MSVRRWDLVSFGHDSSQQIHRSIAGWIIDHSGIRKKERFFDARKRVISEVENQKELYFSTTRGAFFGYRGGSIFE
jgi:hypothetical protein